MKHSRANPIMKNWIHTTFSLPRAVSLFIITVGISPLPSVQAAPVLSFSGFGSAAYAVSDNDNVQFMRGLGGDGAYSDGTWKLDSRLGLQLDVSFNDLFSSTLQGIVRQNTDGDASLQAEWAYVRAQINDFFVLRAGRISDPLFMNSDIREVGYAHTAIRLPNDVYGQSPIANIDGIDLTGRYDFENTSIAARAFAGEKEFRFPGDTIANVDNLLGATIDLERSFSRWRLGYARSDIALISDGKSQAHDILSLLSTAYPPLLPFAEDLGDQKVLVEFISVGTEIDLNSWQVKAEWLQLNTNSLVSDTQSWYLTIARRFNNITPFITISRLKQTTKVAIPNPDVAALSEIMEEVRRVFSVQDQNTVALGLRWDFAPSLSMKMQLENIQRDAMGGTFAPVTEQAFYDNDDVQLLSVGLDFIF